MEQQTQIPNVPPAGGVEQQFAQTTERAFGPVLHQMEEAGRRMSDTLTKSSEAMTEKLELREEALRKRETRAFLAAGAVDVGKFGIKTGIVVGASAGVIYIARAAWRARNAHLAET